jgi:hypothetical protein
MVLRREGSRQLEERSPRKPLRSNALHKGRELAGSAEESYFDRSQVTMRTVFWPLAGSLEGPVVSMRWSPSSL